MKDVIITGIESVLILRMNNGTVLRAQSGKPVHDQTITDDMLKATVVPDEEEE